MDDEVPSTQRTPGRFRVIPRTDSEAQQQLDREAEELHDMRTAGQIKLLNYLFLATPMLSDDEAGGEGGDAASEGEGAAVSEPGPSPHLAALDLNAGSSSSQESSGRQGSVGAAGAAAAAAAAGGIVRRDSPLGAPAEALRVRRLNENALLPKRGSAGAAGYDLASCEDTVVPAKGRAVVKTGLQIAIPAGTYARVAPRSGLAVKHFIDTGAGVVDEDYRGEVGVVLFNHADAPFEVKRGDYVAQLILEGIATPEVVEVESLDGTQRGAGSYGSTGIGS